MAHLMRKFTEMNPEQTYWDKITGAHVFTKQIKLFDHSLEFGNAILQEL